MTRVTAKSVLAQVSTAIVWSKKPEETQLPTDVLAAINAEFAKLTPPVSVTGVRQSETMTEPPSTWTTEGDEYPNFFVLDLSGPAPDDTTFDVGDYRVIVEQYDQ